MVGNGREREKIKIIVPFRSKSMRERKLQKNSKKIKKIPLWLLFRPKYVGKSIERVKINIIVSFCYKPTRKTKFQKNSKKIQKIKKYHYGFISSQNWLEKAEKERK